MEHFDIIIVGAGLSGICTAHYVQKNCPNKRFVILEGRERLGGTWDLFQYPGIRSDSDMNTLGFRFRPWKAQQPIADGPSIQKYIVETAEEDGTAQYIRFNHKVKTANWSSQRQIWTIETEHSQTGEIKKISCNFFIGCSGYYNYEKGYTPEFKGLQKYQGQFIHPQKWPENLDYQDKEVVVIGSGATAITLVPAMAHTGAKKVTMLQRSPTYILARPNHDNTATYLNKILPERWTYSFIRWRNFLSGFLLYQVSKAFPNLIKKLLVKGAKAALPADFDVEKHLTPSYNPWDQRLCLSPDGDFFEAICKGKSTIVTEHIAQFTSKGIQLKTGEILEADIIVSATGLNLQVLGGIQVSIDGKAVDISKSYAYKGTMLSSIPNMALIVGYTNASWTLKAELTAQYLCRLINYLDKKSYRHCVPVYEGGSTRRSVLDDLKSGYVKRLGDTLPSQGEKSPWKGVNNYFKDIKILRYDKMDDGYLKFV